MKICSGYNLFCKNINENGKHHMIVNFNVNLNEEIDIANGVFFILIEFWNYFVYLKNNLSDTRKVDHLNESGFDKLWNFDWIILRGISIEINFVFFLRRSDVSEKCGRRLVAFLTVLTVFPKKGFTFGNRKICLCTHT